METFGNRRGWDEQIGLQAGRKTKMMPPAIFTTDVFLNSVSLEAAASSKPDKD